MLIERAGTVVTQQEFMDVVWHQRGMIVSANTYYQNICILRKGLKKLGFENDPVVTIPRIGLTLSSDTQITVIEASTSISPPQSIERKDVPAELSTLCATEGDFQSEKEDTISAEDNSQPMVTYSIDQEDNEHINEEATLCENEIAAHPFTLKSTDERKIAVTIKQSMRVYAQMFLLATLILVSGVAILGMKKSSETRHFEHYQLAKVEQECRFFLDKNILDHDVQEKALAYGKQFNDKCVKYPWVYINTYAMLPGAAVIRCTKPMTEKNHCISDYFIEDR